MSVARSNDYGDLKKLVTAEGLLDSQPFYYVLKTVAMIATVALALALPLVFHHWAVLVLSAVFAGFAFTQVALLAHDVGHRQGFRGRRTNMMARILFGNVLLGVSHSWWTVKHNQHHATPNHIDEDPDIQFPMIAFSVKQIEGRSRLMKVMIAFQAFIFVTLLPLQGVNIRINSITHLWNRNAKRPWLQAAAMGVHFAAYGLFLWALPSWQMSITFFFVHQGVFGLYNSSIFATNHKGMQVIDADARLDFLREQVLTARDVNGNWFSDFWYGGLNYQIEHHLFPTMPRNNLKKAQPIVRDFCRELGVDYHEAGAFASYGEVFGHLHRVGAALRRRGRGPTALPQPVTES